MIDRVSENKVSVPEGSSGNWRIKKFTINKEESSLHAVRSTFSGYGYRSVTPGNYTKLTRNGQTIMSDTRAEIMDHIEPMSAAQGKVLINGLGLGMFLQFCIRKLTVTEIVCVEKSPDVIKLVKSHYVKMAKKFKKKLTIIEADALEYRPSKGERYDVIWNDIWDNICADNWESMKKLNRKYGKRADWVGSWCKYEIQRAVKLAKEEERQYRYYNV